MAVLVRISRHINTMFTYVNDIIKCNDIIKSAVLEISSYDISRTDRLIDFMFVSKRGF